MIFFSKVFQEYWLRSNDVFWTFPKKKLIGNELKEKLLVAALQKNCMFENICVFGFTNKIYEKD